MSKKQKLTRCKYCGARLKADHVGQYCPTRNCQWEHGVVLPTYQKQQHTPGPWICTPSKTGHRWDITAEINADVWVADVYIGHGLSGKDGECQANAQLIAAAPDLLEACKEALELIRWAYATPKEQQPYLEMIDTINTAIAKAEGK